MQTSGTEAGNQDRPSTLNDWRLFAVALEDGFGRVADIGTRVVRAPTEDGRAMARLGVRAGCFRFLARPMPKLTKLL